MRVSLASFIRSFRLNVGKSRRPVGPAPGTQEQIQSFRKDRPYGLKAYTGFSDRQLVEHLNGNIHYQIFCGIMIPPSLPITNFKIVSAIRNEIASRLDIDSFQELWLHTGNLILITFTSA